MYDDVDTSKLKEKFNFISDEELLKEYREE
jgi:hypothetical protein